ncbi:hypothetical protein DdX_08443 [Ditylenchus destructor]|uniref:Uncharacterized protein n=1 Tax=Ditylenchus destructor TaxID=166010 RepID=A0AAD4R0S2_9BILA|nr:hypothetical protein DdX_08443 [Ditylenchus destructor]
MRQASMSSKDSSNSKSSSVSIPSTTTSIDSAEYGLSIGTSPSTLAASLIDIQITPSPGIIAVPEYGNYFEYYQENGKNSTPRRSPDKKGLKFGETTESESMIPYADETLPQRKHSKTIDGSNGHLASIAQKVQRARANNGSPRSTSPYAPPPTVIHHFLAGLHISPKRRFSLPANEYTLSMGLASNALPIGSSATNSPMRPGSGLMANSLLATGSQTTLSPASAMLLSSAGSPRRLVCNSNDSTPCSSARSSASIPGEAVENDDDDNITQEATTLRKESVSEASSNLRKGSMSILRPLSAAFARKNHYQRQESECSDRSRPNSRKASKCSLSGRMPWKRKNGSMPDLIEKAESMTINRPPSPRANDLHPTATSTLRRVTVVDKPGQDKAHFTGLKAATLRTKKKQNSRKIVVGLNFL